MKTLVPVCIAAANFTFSGWAQTPASSPVKEDALVGTWHIITNLGYEEIVFARDHTFSAVVRGMTAGKISGTWRIDKSHLFKKWTGGELSFLGKSKSADGSETNEELTKLEGGTLTTETPGEFHRYERGSLPEDYKK